MARFIAGILRSGRSAPRAWPRGADV